jgi:hypothetical protein
MQSQARCRRIPHRGCDDPRAGEEERVATAAAIRQAQSVELRPSGEPYGWLSNPGYVAQGDNAHVSVGFDLPGVFVKLSGIGMENHIVIASPGGVRTEWTYWRLHLDIALQVNDGRIFSAPLNARSR